MNQKGIPSYDASFDNERNVYKRLRLSTETDDHRCLNQIELSNQFKEECNIEVSQNQISKLENDQIKEVPKFMLDAYRQYFGVSTDYLLGFTELRTVNLEMQRVSFVTGLSENSLIVLDYLRKCRSFPNKTLAEQNYSTIKCLNLILESYYKDVMLSMDNYCDSRKRVMEDCSVNTLFSMIDDYIYADESVCSQENKIVFFTSKIRSKPVNIESMYEKTLRDDIIREIDKIKNSVKGGDADDLT